jgi:hypothetical protein
MGGGKPVIALPALRAQLDATTWDRILGVHSAIRAAVEEAGCPASPDCAPSCRASASASPGWSPRTGRS